MAQGKAFRGDRAPSGDAPGCAGGPGAQRGTGVHPNLLPWERQRLGGGGKRWLQQPRDADKGEGEGSPAAAGVQPAPPPSPSCLRAGSLGSSQRGTGLIQHHPDPGPAPHSPPPWISGSHIPTDFLGTDTGRPQLSPQLIIWPKRGALGSEQPPQTKPHTTATPCPHGPGHPGQGLPWLSPTPAH